MFFTKVSHKSFFLGLLIVGYQATVLCFETLDYVLGAATAVSSLGYYYYNRCYRSHNARFAEQEIVTDAYDRVQEMRSAYQECIVAYEGANSDRDRCAALDAFVKKSRADKSSVQLQLRLEGLKSFKKQLQEKNVTWAGDKTKALLVPQLEIAQREVASAIPVLELVVEREQFLTISEKLYGIRSLYQECITAYERTSSVQGRSEAIDTVLRNKRSLRNSTDIWSHLRDLKECKKQLTQKSVLWTADKTKALLIPQLEIAHRDVDAAIPVLEMVYAEHTYLQCLDCQVSSAYSAERDLISVLGDARELKYRLEQRVRSWANRTERFPYTAFYSKLKNDLKQLSGVVDKCNGWNPLQHQRTVAQDIKNRYAEMSQLCSTVKNSSEYAAEERQAEAERKAREAELEAQRRILASQIAAQLAIEQQKRAQREAEQRARDAEQRARNAEAQQRQQIDAERARQAENARQERQRAEQQRRNNELNQAAQQPPVNPYAQPPAYNPSVYTNQPAPSAPSYHDACNAPLPSAPPAEYDYQPAPSAPSYNDAHDVAPAPAPNSSQGFGGTSRR